jgi:hypothetical protein
MTWETIRNMPSRDYHARKSHIGSTSAKHILTSRRKFADLIDRPSKQSQAMKDGESFHLAVLQPDEFARRVRSEPVNPKTGKPYGVDTFAFQSFMEQNPEAIFPPDFTKPLIDRMPFAVKCIFAGGESEVSYFGSVCGVGVKFRPDYICGYHIFDLKTIDDIDNIERAITKYQYWFSAAWYRRLALEMTGERHRFTLVFAEKNPPYRWRIVDLDASYLMHGDAKVDYALTTIHECQVSGCWDDNDDLNMMVGMPDWMDETEENESDGES